MALYDKVNGVYRKVSKKYDPVDGVYRKVKAAYDPVDGVYRQYFSGGPSVGELAVGDSVWLNVDSTLTEFLVVHQGNPDSAIYDASCDGTWLLAKDICESRVWDSSDNDYQNSDIHSYLNSTFVGLLDSNIQSAIKRAKIPYWNGIGEGGSLATGSNGLSTKIFLLSGYEVGWTISTDNRFPEDGACLSYFIGTSETDTKRIAYNSMKLVNGGQAAAWTLRSPRTNSPTRVWYVDVVGNAAYLQSYSESHGVRPAFILDSSTPIDQSTGFNIIA